MSQQKIPDKYPIGKENKYVLEALKVIEDNLVSHSKHRQEIRSIQKMITDSFKVEEPAGLNRLPSSLIIQLGDSIQRKIKIPTATYWLQDVSAQKASLLGKILRDGVESVMEMGGFEACLTEKPAGFRQAIDMGDCVMRIGVDGNRPIRFDLVDPDQVYVDSNATVFNSITNSRKVTRCVVIYTYDYDQAKQMYPTKKFGLGDIPSQNAFEKDFTKTYEQDASVDDRTVQIAHFFDIGGKDPVHLVFAGHGCSILEKNIGKDYPFVDKKTGEPYPPIDNFHMMDSREGIWNWGIGQLFYKYAVVKRQLKNKAITQSMNSMSDTQVISTKANKGGEMLARIRDARTMAKNGQMGIIINDSGEEVKVSKLQSDQYEQGLRLLDEWMDAEVKRFGYNLDAIREAQTTTATQILAETEVDDASIASIIERNTEFFKRNHYRTMDFIRNYVDEKDETPIWTNVKMPELKDQGAIDPTTGQPALNINAKTGKPVQGRVVITLGEIKRLLDKYGDGIYVEVDTRTGVKEKDSTKTAKALLALRTNQNPAVQNEAFKMLLQANNIPMDDDIVDSAPAEAQAGAVRDVSTDIMKEAGM